VKVAKAEERLWLHTTLDNRPPMVQRNEWTNYDHLRHQVKV
jgi:hypothetical protein